MVSAARVVSRPTTPHMVAALVPPNHSRSFTSKRTCSPSCACVTCTSSRATHSQSSSSSSSGSRRWRHSRSGITTTAIASVVGVAALTLTTVTLAESKHDAKTSSPSSSSSSSSASASASASPPAMSPEEARQKLQELIASERQRLEIEAKDGNAKSQLALGVLLLRDIGTLEGVTWIRRAAATGLPDGRHALAILQLDGIGSTSDQQSGGQGVMKDQSAALASLRTLAAEGHADSQLALSMVFDQGIGVSVDKAASTQWLFRSAESGNPRAQYMAASSLLENNPAEADTTRAMKWMYSAAEQGDPMAQAALGSILLQVATNDDESSRTAVEWLIRAESQGSVTAHYLLGQCVEQGRGGLRKDATVGARMKKEAVQAGYMAQ